MRIISFYLVLSIITCSTYVYAQENKEYEDAFSSYEQGNIDESYIYLKRSLNDNPSHLPSKILMAEVLALSGYYVDSLTEFEESIASGADLNLVIESYIRVLLVVGDFSKILDIPDKQLTPVKKGLLLSAKARVYASRNDHKQAQAFYHIAFKMAPNNINILNGAARYYLEIGEHGKAKSLLDDSILINSNMSNTYELLASYYGDMDDLENQIDVLHKGLALSKSHPVLLRQLVAAYATKGNYTEARKVLIQTLAISPNDPMASLLLSYVAAQLEESELSKQTLTDLVNTLSLIDSSELAQQDYMLFVSAIANYAANNLEIAKGQLERYVNRNPQNFAASKLLADVFEREQSYVASANILERFSDIIEADVSLVAKLCGIYIKANQNHKCNSLLVKTRAIHGDSTVFLQTESSLLAARGKFDLALVILDNLHSKQLSVIAQTAVIAIQNDQLDVADNAVIALLNKSPDNPDFLNLQASILKKKGRLSEAERIYKNILIDNPEHFSVTFNLAHIYYLTKRLDLAKQHVQTLIERQPTDVDLLLLLAKILTANQEFLEAKEIISKTESLSRNNKKTDTAFIQLYLATNDLDNALFRINRLLKDDLTSVQLLTQRANIYFELGKQQEAQKDLRVLFGLLSDDPQSLFALSNLQQQYGDIEGAMTTLQRADTLNTNSLFINRNIAKLAIILDMSQLAEEKINWLMDTALNDADIILLRGDFALYKHDKNAAAAFYLQALRVNSTLAPAIIGVFQLAQQGVKSKEFESAFTMLATTPKKHTFATHLLADFYFTNGQFEKAKAAYMSIADLSTYTPLPMVLNNLANIYLHQDNLDAAYKFAQRAYQLVKQDAAILDTLGWITVQRGQYDQGLNLLRQAYSMNAQDPNTRFHIAFALHKLDRNAESSRELKILLSDFADFDKRVDAISLQQSLKI